MIKDNIERIKNNIPENVEILAAVKTRTLEEIKQAYYAGLRHFGQNYVQEARSLIEELPSDIHWHMIGHLQRNKVKQAIQVFEYIDTVDSRKLLDEIEKRAANLDKRTPVMLEINIAKEKAKAGVMPENASELAEYISRSQYVELIGVMTMGPANTSDDRLRPFFRKARELFESIKNKKLVYAPMKYLSMGMSDSYQVAIEEGANLIRLGTAIFGPRHKI